MNKAFKMKSDEFWQDIIENEDGTLNRTQIYKELSDFYFLMEQVPEIYCAITNNQLSNLMYTAKTVIGVYEDCSSKEIDEAIENEKEVWKDDHNESIDKLKKEVKFLQEYIESLTKCVERNEQSENNEKTI